MNNISYINRYNDTINLISIDNNTFELDLEGLYYRYGFGDSENITDGLRFVDPSGGPYIGIGFNLGNISSLEEHKDLIVTKIIGFAKSSKFIIQVTNKVFHLI